ncbi:hypothetical protein SAMN04487928_12516 [Butyrivibrio proteoclasticus]|uniref:Uncharacterized protein n=2 Tax=Butyrivibrio proteoclasticus TaxID=43305 RepID=A0A1I5WT84_9FIRM|nr:hypothetical protein SAMN04487928_12516 [Butyrivibrio proteoclasticus]
MFSIMFLRRMKILRNETQSTAADSMSAAVFRKGEITMIEAEVNENLTAEEKVDIITNRLSSYSFRMGEVVDAKKKEAKKKKQLIKRGKTDGRDSVLQKLENYKKAKGVFA